MTSLRSGPANPTLRILAVVLLNLICYIDIGLPLAVIPVFVHGTLGYNTIIAGLAVSLQYLATFASRAQAGRFVDGRGAKPAVMIGLATCMTAGLALMLSGLFSGDAGPSVLLLIASRILMGVGESWTATGAILWNIGRVGAERTAQVISWNGITSYGGIAFGAPLGALLSQLAPPLGGLTGVGLLSAVLPLLGLALAARYAPVPPMVKGESMPFAQVFWRVLPYGIVLACGSVGFGAISACLSLYFADRHWDGAALGLMVFGLVFILVRLFFSRQIGRRGGTKVAAVSLAVEVAGLLILWRSSGVAVADLGAALTGAGFSLVFPALGVEAVTRVGPQNRGAALGAFSVFLDIGIGVSGPMLGLAINRLGYGPMFLAAALFTGAGVGATLLLRGPRRPGVA
jgi:predicted MFS family arabinose efflux permease